MPILSIIIPVYNTSKYLKECLDSIVSQNCQDVEIILVNDGSTDESPKICENYKNKFPNIVFVNNSNHGVSYSRNCGIDIANGKYLLFVDSDDILVANGLSQICRLLTENSLMYVYGYKKIYENREESYILNPKTISSVQALRLLVSDNNFGGYLWNKVFLKEIIEKNNIIFDDKIAMNEDMKFCFDYISCCDKINLVDDVFYKYRCRKSGAMNKKIDKTHATSAMCYKYIIDYSKDDFVLSKSRCLYLKAYYKYKKFVGKDFFDLKLINDIRKKDYGNFSTSDKLIIRMYKYFPFLNGILRIIRNRNKKFFA